MTDIRTFDSIDIRADLDNSVDDLFDDGCMCPLVGKWQHGFVRTADGASDYGHVVGSNSKRIVMTDIQHAEHDIYISIDAGYVCYLYAYSSDDESSLLFQSTAVPDEYYDYSFYSLGWYRTMFIPKGMYYRLNVRKNPEGSDAIDIDDTAMKVHAMSDLGRGSKIALDMVGENIIRAFQWKVNTSSSGYHDDISLFTPIIQTAEKALEIKSDGTVKVNVVLYDDDDASITNLETFAIHKGERFRIFLRDGASATAKITYDALNHVEIIPHEDGDNFYVLGTNAPHGIGYADTRAIQANIEHADRPMMVYLDDFTTYGLTWWDYQSDDSINVTGVWHGFQQSPLYLQKGLYYRLCVGKSGNTAMTYDEAMAVADKIKIAYLDEPNTDAHFSNGVRGDLSSVKKRIAAIENEQLPSYYTGTYNISSRCETIRNLNPKIIPDVAQFIFISDMHLYSGNSKKSRLLMDYVIGNTCVDMVVNGGDVVDDKPFESLGYDIQTSYGYKTTIEDSRGYIIPDGCKDFMLIAGNHDAGAGWNPTTDAKLDADTFVKCSLIGRSSGNVVFDESKLQYYVDDDYHKIRWLVCSFGNALNIGEWDSSKDHGVSGMSDINCAVFVADALNSLKPGWSAVVMNHILINVWPNKGAQGLEDLCDAYNARNSAATISGSSKLFDFSHGLGEVICIIGGHLHLDYSYLTSGGLNCIITTTDCRAQQGKIVDNRLVIDSTIRQDGTVREQAFDVFTINKTSRTITANRIGYGDSVRSWTY